MTIPTISTLPTAPARTDPPATFVTRADSFLAALVTMQSELNTSIGAMNTDIAGVNNNVTAAQAAQTGAELAETNAATSESNAATSESNAATSESNAATSESNAAATYDAFDDRYLGAKASDPTLDNDGNALQTGAQYFNTTNTVTRVYNGSAFQDSAAITTSVTLSQVTDFPTQSGQSGKYLTTNGTVPSWAEVSSSPVAQAVASGALANGDLVAVNADGTVSVIGETVGGPSVGAEAVFNNANQTDVSSAFDSSANKVVVAYKNIGNSSYGTVVVGTVSGTSISFGTAVVFNSATTEKISVTFDSSSNKIVIAYRDGGNSNKGAAIVGTVSGTSISFGTAVLFSNTNSNHISATFDSSLNKIVIAYADNGNSNHGTAVVGTVSGDSISFGTAAVFQAASSTYNSITFDSNLNKIVISFTDGGNSNYGTAVVGTVSGTNISFGTPVVFSAAGSFYNKIVFDSNVNKVAILYVTTDVKAIVGTVSGTSISFGTEVTFISGGSTSQFSLAFDSNINKVVITYANPLNSSYGTVSVATVSGTTISFGSNFVFNNANSSFNSTTFDSNSNKVVISYKDSGNSNYGTGIVLSTQTTIQNLTAENYIGVSDAAYTDGATANIQVTGAVDDAQSGLTAGEAYYVQLDGTLATTPDNPSVFAGTALSATELLIGKSDATSPSVFVTASGALANGDLVVVNADGTVSVVAESPAEFGSSEVFENASIDYISATYDSTNNKIVVAYQDVGNSQYGTAIVGTVSGTSISFGTAVVFNTARADQVVATYDSTNEKIVIAYADGGNSYYSTAIVGTVSGTSISFGTPVVFQSVSSSHSSITFDSTNNKVVIVYKAVGGSRAVVGTVSGTSISFGTPVVFESGTTYYNSATYDSTNNKIVIAYRDAGNSDYGTAIVGSVSGTSISFGTPVVFESARSDYNSSTYDSTNNKIVITYQDFGNSFYGTAIVGTVSSTSISFGTAVVFKNATSNRISATYDSANDKVVITYQDDGNSGYGTASVGTVSGTSISFGTAEVFNTASTIYTSATYDSANDKVVIAYADNGNSGYGTAIVYKTTSTTNLTAENYIGVSNGAYSNAATANVQITGSVNNAQSGLTAGQAYYAQLDGTLATTPDTTSVFAGTALSATELLIGKSPAVSLGALGVTATAAELNYVSGVTSAIQAQIDGKLDYVAPSTSGNVLTSDGTNWASTAPAGGQIWTFIDRYDVTSGANTHDFLGDFDSTYNDYWIKLIDWYHGTTGAVGSIDFQFYRNGTLKTSGLYNSNGISSTGGDGTTAQGRHKATQEAQFLTYGQVRSDPTDDSFNGNLFIYNANSNRISYNFTGGNFSDDTNVAQFASYNGYHNESGTTLTGIRIMDRQNTSTLTVNGRIEIYGGTIQS